LAGREEKGRREGDLLIEVGDFGGKGRTEAPLSLSFSGY
jgi:selenophosphate synthetase-related protein